MRMCVCVRVRVQSPSLPTPPPPSIIISLLWLLHIGLYMVPMSLGSQPLSLFLNEFFIWFDSWFSMLGTICVGTAAVFLLLCVIKGNFKFGMRFFLVKIHPIKYGATMINSMLFNLG